MAASYVAAQGLPLQWTQPEPVSPDTADTVYQVDFALAGTGDELCCTWLDWQGHEAPYCFKVSRHNGTWWLPAESLGSTPYSLYHGIATRPVVDSQFRVWVSWHQSSTPPDSTVFCYRRYEGDTWTAPATISIDTAYRGFNYTLAPRPDSGMVAVWVKSVLGSATCLFMSEENADSWTTPEVIDSFPNYELRFSTDVAVLNDSQVMAVWDCSYDGWNVDVFSSVRTLGAWSEPVPVVSQDPSVDFDPYLCVSPSCSVRVFWQKELDVYTARYTGTNWVEPLMLVDDARGAGYCTDELGRIWVVYDVYIGGREYQTTVRYFDGQVWSDTSAVTVDRLGGGARIAVAYGRVWVLWGHVDSEASPTKALIYYSSASVSGICERPARLPASGRVLRASPNPFRQSTRITLVGDKWLSVNLCDAAGRQLCSLTEGRRQFDWSPPKNEAGQGVFFLRATTDDGKTQTLKLIRTR
jgi:hypothetical protein